jgi:ribonuclease BN (tRNA processing enzyme)
VQDFSPAISNYHAGLVEEIITMVPKKRVKIGHVAVEATPSDHTDETTIGFKIFSSNGIISYVSDTALTKEVVKAHRMARVLIIACTRPLRSRIPHHLSTEDAAEMISVIKPEVALLTHFGLRILRFDPDKEATWIQERTGIETVAARDGMVVDVDTDIRIQSTGERKPDRQTSD